MSPLALLLVVMAMAFAVAVALRAHADVEHFKAKLDRMSEQLQTIERDLPKHHGGPVESSRASAQGPPSRNAGPDQIHPIADPRVYVQLVPDQPHDRVILSNRSAATARDVSLELRFPDGESPFLPEFPGFPVPHLRQGVPYIVLASFRNGHGPPAAARLEWRDPDGVMRIREFPLRW